ncbi:MAG: hypothetical protein NZ839_00545 [Endomicrobia bacterium]|nr:hypothetical protein [Endomicrobiia bacterium]
MEREAQQIGFSSVRRDFWGTVYVNVNTQSYSHIPADTILVWDNSLSAYVVATGNTNPLTLSANTRHVRLLQNIVSQSANSVVRALVASLFVNLPDELHFYNTATNRFERGVIINRPAGGFTINS